MTIDTRVAGTRSSVFLVATLKTEDGEISVKVRNLSTSGAQIQSKEAPPPAGSKGLFVRKEAEIPYKVIWQEGQKFGIQFDEEIDENELMVQTGKAERSAHPVARMHRPVQNFRRPGLTSRFSRPGNMKLNDWEGRE